MTLIFSRRTNIKRAGLLLVIMPGIAGCVAPAPAPAVPRSTRSSTNPGPAAARPVAPGSGEQQNTVGLDGNGKPVLFNDPPASPDTPLCGRQAREINAIGATLQGPRVVSSGICASFACYDPLTATYIGADGYRHVCR